MLGMMLYIDNFAGNLQGVQTKLDYLKECNVNCIHLMPFLDSPEGRSDGGYAVADFRKVKPELGTMEDLAKLTDACHAKDMNVCMDFVMNHTSEDHEWAKRARNGEGEYMSRYFFYDNDEIPKQYEETVPQVFPTTAPGNFTYLPDLNHYVLTTFYPYLDHFSSLSEVRGKKISADIEDGIKYVGDENSIRQLISILVDNAMKYAVESADISISLKRDGRKVKFVLKNLTDGMEEGSQDILFERFYRPDSSRNSETGGSGIGLSLAKSIVESHKGRIIARCDGDGYITFQVTL